MPGREGARINGIDWLHLATGSLLTLPSGYFLDTGAGLGKGLEFLYGEVLGVTCLGHIQDHRGCPGRAAFLCHSLMCEGWTSNF